MFREFEDYKDKDIVILGGGDGALLNALLKEEPRYIYMLEVGFTFNLFMTYSTESIYMMQTLSEKCVSCSWMMLL